MIRFIDLRPHEEDIGERFAFWDTATDRFVQDETGRVAWNTFAEFEAGFARDPYFVGRCRVLAPEWAGGAP